MGRHVVTISSRRLHAVEKIYLAQEKALLEVFHAWTRLRTKYLLGANISLRQKVNSILRSYHRDVESMRDFYGRNMKMFHTCWHKCSIDRGENSGSEHLSYVTFTYPGLIKCRIV